MAIFILDDFNITNSFKDISSITYEVSEDISFKHLVDSTYKNTNIINGWFTPLNKFNGGNYNEHDILHIRCKVYIDNRYVNGESDWYYLTINTNDYKRIRITYNNKLMGEELQHSKLPSKTIW